MKMLSGAGKSSSSGLLLRVILASHFFHSASGSISHFNALSPVTTPKTLNSLTPELTTDPIQSGDSEEVIKTPDMDLNNFFQEKGPELPPWSQYKPACVAHTQELVETLDNSYTDMQLKHVLKHECWLDKEFTNEVYEDSFDNEKNCKKFAERLTLARKLELETGSLAGYEDFCAKYYEHRGGKIDKKDKKKEKKEVKKEAPPPAQGIEEGALIFCVSACIVYLVGLAAARMVDASLRPKK